MSVRWPGIGAALTTLVVVGCLAAPQARAGYLASNPEPEEGDPPELAFVAADGETNHFTFSLLAEQLAVRDAGAPVFVLSLGGAAARCPIGSGTNEVLCSLSAGRGGFITSDQVAVALLDGDDSASVTAGRSAEILGGAGNDVLASTVRASIVGEAGNDRLVAGRFDDHLDGGPGRDHLDGGPGQDFVSYGEARSLRLDLRLRRPQGPAGNLDVLVRIENVAGTFGDDRLIGNASSNLFFGAFGDDTLIGGAGNDMLAGSAGRDRVYGGAGADRLEGDGGFSVIIGPGPRPSSDDYISAVDGRRDLVSCGPGRDTARVDRLDRVIACERVLRG